MLNVFLFTLLVVGLHLKPLPSLPIESKDAAAAKITPPDVLKFMRRFGYLEKNPDDSEALYHESAIVEAVKKVQKYGALNQTGKLDDLTLKLLTKPRCGVPDIEAEPYYLRQQEDTAKNSSSKARKKRFIFGAKTWTKRNIKYLIGNWSLKIPRKQIENDIERAFNVWSQYSNLKFHRVYDTSADIIVGFGRQYHGDNYPFDGAGNVLAHAFYPYEMGSWGGDVHFDEDENWKQNSATLANGVDFYTVALHELGHSLGLAHAPIYSSIMFPYYKGPQHNVLNYDDTLAMYNAYLNKQLDDDLTNTNTDYDTLEVSNENEQTTAATWHNNRKGKFPIYTRKIYTYFNVNRAAYYSAVPNICEGKFDAVCYFNNSMHIFKGAYAWRLSANYRVIMGYPKQLKEIFLGLPTKVQHIDACYQRFDKTLVLFSGQQIWFYKNTKHLINNATTTIEILLGKTAANIDHVNAVLLWPRNNRTYIFADTIFWRYNDELQTMDVGYPKAITRWRGIPENIDAAATLPNGKTYFFKDNFYWLYNNLLVQPERGYPRRASTAWLNCTLRTTQTPFRKIPAGSCKAVTVVVSSSLLIFFVVVAFKLKA